MLSIRALALLGSVWLSYASLNHPSTNTVISQITNNDNTTDAQPNVQSACLALSTTLTSPVLFPTSSNYTAESTAYWDKRSNASPACILLPNTADDVSTALSTLSANRIPFAVRGGGHMNNPGSNSIGSNGVLLALDRLTELSLSPSLHSPPSPSSSPSLSPSSSSSSNISSSTTTPTLAVGPGNRWVDVYAALAPHGLYAIGGRLKTIGVPGLLLIGGVHYFANRYGFGMDNVVGYEVVLGNGTRVRASAGRCNGGGGYSCDKGVGGDGDGCRCCGGEAGEEENADLFWALKGGGASNFGVVTRFELRTFSVPLVSTTVQVFAEEQVAAFVSAACGLARNDDAGVGAGAVLTVSRNITTGVVEATLLGVQEGVDRSLGRFEGFNGIPAKSRVFNVSRPVDWHERLDTPFQMFRIQFGQHAVKADPEQVYLLYQMWNEAINEIQDVEGLYPTFVLNSAPRTAARVAKTNGIGNTWGLEDDDDYIWWEIATSWARAEDDERMTSWSKSTVARLHELNKAKELASEFVYMGDAGEYQDVFKGFPAENVERMKNIRARYDPGRVFTELNTGGFKLPP